MAFSFVEPKDCHVSGSTGEIERDEDCAYWYVMMHGGLAANSCDTDRKVWWL